MTANYPLAPRAEDLIARYMEGSLSADEDIELAAMLNHDEQTVRRVAELLRLDDLLDQVMHEERSIEAFLAAMRIRLAGVMEEKGDVMTSQLLPVASEGVLADEEIRREEDLTLTAALAQQWQSAPWYVSSVAIHCVIFLLLLLLPVDPVNKPVRRIIVECDLLQEEEKMEEPENDIVERDPDVVTDQTNPEPAPVVVTTDFEISDHNETDDDMDMESARGDPDSISTFDDIDGSPALMGVGASGGKGGGGRFGNRNGGGRRNAVSRGGGSRRTESAVDWALRWLAEHQEADGHWDCGKYEGWKKAFHGETQDNYDIGVTSLATLAFLGAGNSCKFGKYKSNVRRSVTWLANKQNDCGRVGGFPHGYHAAMALMAMSEAYGMSGHYTLPGGKRLKDVAQKCVDWAVESQCPAGGWEYKPKSMRNDTTVSSWWVLGLKSARTAGLNVPYDVMERALKYFQAATSDPKDDKGYGGICTVSYDSKNAPTVKDVVKGGNNTGKWNVGNKNIMAIRYGVMPPISMSCLQFLGRPRTDPQVRGCANMAIRLGVPETTILDFYRWYYSALGLFQMGVRSDYWRKWNDPMKKTLLGTQVKAGTFKEKKGSWNPDTDPWGPAWGRVGQTALGALMLEVYYRYYDTHERKHKKH